MIRAANSALIAVSVPGGRPPPGLRVCASGQRRLHPRPAARRAGRHRLSYDWLFVGDGLGTLFFAVWTARVVPARGAARNRRARTRPWPRRPGLWAELRARPALLVLLVAILVADVVYRQQYSTFPVFLADHGMDAASSALVIALNGGRSSCSELPAAVALRKRPALPVIGTGCPGRRRRTWRCRSAPGRRRAVLMMVLLSLGRDPLQDHRHRLRRRRGARPRCRAASRACTRGSRSAGSSSAPAGRRAVRAAPGLLWPLCAVLGGGGGAAVLGAHGCGGCGRRPRSRTGSGPRRSPDNGGRGLRGGGTARAPGPGVGGRRVPPRLPGELRLFTRVPAAAVPRGTVSPAAPRTSRGPVPGPGGAGRAGDAFRHDGPVGQAQVVTG